MKIIEHLKNRSNEDRTESLRKLRRRVGFFEIFNLFERENTQEKQFE